MVRVHLLRILIQLCISHHIDPFLAESIIKVESGWNINTIGLANERGLFQLNPTSFPNISIDKLSNPELNMKLGIAYIEQMKKECIHKENFSYVVCYNRGSVGGAKVKNYKQDKYYARVMQEYYKLIEEIYANQNQTVQDGF